jgi:hypothetical protein
MENDFGRAGGLQAKGNGPVRMNHGRDEGLSERGQGGKEKNDEYVFCLQEKGVRQ